MIYIESVQARFWCYHVTCIILKAYITLGPVQRYKFRRTLDLSIVKSQLSYATEVWSAVCVTPLRTGSHE